MDVIWKCSSCGCQNSGNFCSRCGQRRGNGSWVCSCGKQNKREDLFCPNCGSSKADITTNSQYHSTARSMPESNPTTVPPTIESSALSGILGAFLFSLSGVLIQFFLLKLGYIAAASSVVTFSLAMTGFVKFSNSENPPVVLCMACSAVFTLLAIYAGTVLFYIVSIVSAFADQSMTVSYLEAWKMLQSNANFDPVRDELLENLLMSYLFGGICALVHVFRFFSAKRKANSK